MQLGHPPVPVVDPVRRLAMPAESRRAYLEAIGTAPSADELALEFDDVLPRLMSLDAEAVALAERIDALLEAMSGPGPVWHVDALAGSPRWASLERILAVDFPGAAALRAQLDHVPVLKPWYEGSASLDLSGRPSCRGRRRSPAGGRAGARIR